VQEDSKLGRKEGWMKKTFKKHLLGAGKMALNYLTAEMETHPMNTQFNPNNNEEVEQETADQAAFMSNIVMKLKHLQKTLPDLAVNEVVRNELNHLAKEAEGSFTRIRAELIRQRTPDS
jgi:hypothetical protein